MSILNVEHLSHGFGDRAIFEDVSFRLLKGEHIGLVGANGEGKSTFMNIVADVLDKTSGDILYNEKNVKEMKADYRKLIGYLPQNVGLYPGFTARETLEYFGYLRGGKKEDMEEGIDRALSATNLLKYKDNKISSFSGGMKRRMAIAITLIGDPEILIFDEPTTGLDPQERVRFRELLLKVRENKTVIISTHIVSDIDKLADHVLIIKEGKVVHRIEGKHDDLEGIYMKFFEGEE